MNESKCVMCNGAIPEWRLGSDYCSLRCWEKDHGAQSDRESWEEYECEPEDLE